MPLLRNKPQEPLLDLIGICKILVLIMENGNSYHLVCLPFVYCTVCHFIITLRLNSCLYLNTRIKLNSCLYQLGYGEIGYTSFHLKS